MNTTEPAIKRRSARNTTSPHQLTINFESVVEAVETAGTPFQEIKNMMPFLFDTQVEDILRAEERFQEGKGYLFTNGTGTGKTFVGLGIANRFYKSGRREILIVVPTEKKCIDWVEEGEKFGLRVYQLESIRDRGQEISVTTYANFYQNESLLLREFDLVIYDESHYLNQSQNGAYTAYYYQHQNVVKVPSAVKERLRDLPEFYRTNERGDRILNRIEFEDAVASIVSKTKVVFLSATPFAYHKSIKYADGCLFEIDEQIEEREHHGYSYNEPVGWEKFMVENFGYRMRYNRCTIPESGVDVNLLERNFFEKFKEKGVMSTRQIDLDYDYSRQFITLDSQIGDRINRGLELFYDERFRKKYEFLSSRISKKYNNNYVSQLLECIKAKEIHVRIQQHLDMGRKVVVFHNYNNSLVSHPFQFEASELLEKDEQFSQKLVDEIRKFRKEYAEYWDMDLAGLLNTREAIKKHFPHAKEYNGIVSKKLRNTYINEFNKDDSDVNLLIVQVKAGQEGISLHDRSGKHQRVLINLGLPTAPTQAIQTEGRIYREGLKSNAIYEYATLQTTTERIAFATKIAERSKTAENLAMGNLARDLETAFKEGYKDSSYDVPSVCQGIGGKEADKFLFSISEFDKAKTFYYQRGKKTSSNKSKEGTDYFATPEPLGKKMVEWLNPQPNDMLLEPSAGHGAIARFFPGYTTNHFIEQSHYLTSELAINATGTVHNKRFEDYHIGNKFQGICMNPPFGVGGKTAIEHIAKACKHLSWSGGEILAIIPNGGSMEKRLNNFLNHPDNSKYHLTGEIILPTCTFERAGTSVSCRVIRIQDARHQGRYKEYRHIDLSYLQDAESFFSAIEFLNF